MEVMPKRWRLFWQNRIEGWQSGGMGGGSLTASPPCWPGGGAVRAKEGEQRKTFRLRNVEDNNAHTSSPRFDTAIMALLARSGGQNGVGPPPGGRGLPMADSGRSSRWLMSMSSWQIWSHTAWEGGQTAGIWSSGTPSCSMVPNSSRVWGVRTAKKFDCLV